MKIGNNVKSKKKEGLEMPQICLLFSTRCTLIFHLLWGLIFAFSRSEKTITFYRLKMRYQILRKGTEWRVMAAGGSKESGQNQWKGTCKLCQLSWEGKNLQQNFIDQELRGLTQPCLKLRVYLSGEKNYYVH